MSWQGRELSLVRRFGRPTCFAVDAVLTAILPGAPTVVELARCGIERAPEASDADLERLEQLLAVLDTDLSAVIGEVVALGDRPAPARRMVNLAIAQEQDVQEAVRKLNALAQTFDRLIEQNGEALHHRDYPDGQLLLPLVNRLASVADWMDELCEEGTSPESFCACLEEVQRVEAWVVAGELDQAHDALRRLTQERPSSAVALVALAAVQALQRALDAAMMTLDRAKSLGREWKARIQQHRDYFRLITRDQRVIAAYHRHRSTWVFWSRVYDCKVLGGLSPDGCPSVATGDAWIDVPGWWFRREEGTANEQWKKVALTPGPVHVQPGAAYELEVDPLAGDNHLHGLRSLGELPTVPRLKLYQCQRLTDRALAHLIDFQQLQHLRVGDCARITDAGLIHLRDCPSLRELDLSHSWRLTDAGVAHLRGLRGLHTLSLYFCGRQITDAGLANIGTLPTLQSLDLGCCTGTTDAGFVHLVSLAELRFLSLVGCGQLTDAVLEHVGSLRSLQNLRLHGCEQITGATLERLGHLSSLRELVLSDCQRLTDAGLAHLSELTSLQNLSLYACRGLTDAGLTYLHGLTGLAVVNLCECPRITPAGIDLLRAALPSTFIEDD